MTIGNIYTTRKQKKDAIADDAYVGLQNASFSYSHMPVPTSSISISSSIQLITRKLSTESNLMHGNIR